jgi:hypothetical protein
MKATLLNGTGYTQVQLKEGMSRQRTRRTISRLRAKGKLYVPVSNKFNDKYKGE